MRGILCVLVITIAYSTGAMGQAAVHRVPRDDATTARAAARSNASDTLIAQRIRDRRVRRPAMFWGTLLGAAAGAAAGLWLAGYEDDKCPLSGGGACDAIVQANRHRQTNTVVFSVAGGALIGAGVGFLWPRRD